MAEPHTAHRHLQLSRPASTPPKNPTPIVLRQAAFRSVAPKRQPRLPRLGGYTGTSPVFPPTATPLSPWIYPNLIFLDTHCRSPLSHLTWIAWWNDRCGNGLSRSVSPGPRHPKVTRALRVASLPSHDGKCVQPHPGCLRSPSPSFSGESDRMITAPFLPPQLVT